MALDPAVFDTRAPVYVAWTLTAFWPAQCAVAGGLLALAAVLALGTLRLVRRHAA